MYLVKYIQMLRHLILLAGRAAVQAPDGVLPVQLQGGLLQAEGHPRARLLRGQQRHRRVSNSLEIFPDIV